MRVASMFAHVCLAFDAIRLINEPVLCSRTAALLQVPKVGYNRVTGLIPQVDFGSSGMCSSTGTMMNFEALLLFFRFYLS